MTLAEVKLWGRTIGAVSLEDGGRFAAFQYDPAFAGSGIEVSPLTMPLRDPCQRHGPERFQRSRCFLLFDSAGFG